MNISNLFDTINKLGQSSKKKIAEPVICMACDYGQTSVVFLEVEKFESQIKLLNYFCLDRIKDQNDQIKSLSDARERLSIPTNRIRLSVKGQGVIVRFVQLPKMSSNELKSALAFEAEKYIPFKFNEVIMDFAILENDIASASGPMMNVLLVAVKQEEIYSLIQTFQSANYEVELVDIDALACANALEFCAPADVKECIGFLDIGSQFTTLSIIQNEQPRFIRDISFGMLDILKRVQRKTGVSEKEILKSIEGPSEPTSEIWSLFRDGVRSLISEIRVSIDYYMDQTHGAESVKKLYLGGGGSEVQAIQEMLTEELRIDVKALNFMDRIQVSPNINQEELKRIQSSLSVALGICLRNI